MEAELAALDKMAAIKRCKGPEALRMRKDPNVVIVPSKLVFTVKPGLEPGKIRRFGRLDVWPVETSLASPQRN